MKVRQVAAFALFVLFFMPLVCEDSHTPVPYDPEEFPTWQKDLRRAEIIAFGSLPFVTFTSSIYYDVYRYYDHGQDAAYKPWPFKNKNTAIALSEEEQKKILLASICVSVGVALFDYGFRAIRRGIRNRRIDKENELEVNPIEIEPIPDDESAEAGDSSSVVISPVGTD